MAGVQNGVVRVGDAEYRWSVFRQPMWTRGQSDVPILLGLAILVEPPGQNRRKLVLEFDADRNRHRDMPQHQRFRLSDGRLIQAIDDAMRAGYDADSRGKRFVFQAGALQPR